ncbi:MAG TPA: Uma2 family endonuclease [Pseudonocardiaceae bacterium]|nr:Uma2 family endonuclease [Pseudonocardiaceae bacterium]
MNSTIPHPEGLTAEDYEALPEEFCRSIEVVDGAIILPPVPRKPHQRVVRRLANAIEVAADDRVAVDIDIDLRLRDVPLLNRRPDIAVYDASGFDDTVLRPEQCLLVVEVMSPTSMTTDQNDKPAEYAAAGITHFWRIEDIDHEQRTMKVFRYQLDPTTHAYAPVGVDVDTLAVTDPFRLTIDLADLY